MHKMGPCGPKHYTLATSFTQKMPESSDSMYSSILMLENIWPHHFTWSGPNSHVIVNLFQFSLGPRGPTIGKKLTISCEFGPLQVKWWYHMFSSMKKEEYMECELSAKNIVIGSLGTQRWAVFAVWCLFLKKHTNFLNQTVTHECFPY